jgi:hypothetical protein
MGRQVALPQLLGVGDVGLFVQAHAGHLQRDEADERQDGKHRGDPHGPRSPVAQRA